MLKYLFQRKITYSLHRWQIFKNDKYLNCYERIEKCHSMNFEDYNLDRNILKSTTVNNEKNQDESERSKKDVNEISFTYYHF